MEQVTLPMDKSNGCGKRAEWRRMLHQRVIYNKIIHDKAAYIVKPEDRICVYHEVLKKGRFF